MQSPYGIASKPGDILSLQKLTGHETLETLKRFLRLTDQKAQITHDRFPHRSHIKGIFQLLPKQENEQYTTED